MRRTELGMAVALVLTSALTARLLQVLTEGWLA